jgi:hypothetical protein
LRMEVMDSPSPTWAFRDLTSSIRLIRLTSGLSFA